MVNIIWEYSVIIEINYCMPCGFGSHADSLAEALCKSLNIEVKLIRGDDGVFNVIVDG